MHGAAHNRRLNEKWLKLGLQQALGKRQVNMSTCVAALRFAKTTCAS